MFPISFLMIGLFYYIAVFVFPWPISIGILEARKCASSEGNRGTLSPFFIFKQALLEYFRWWFVLWVLLLVPVSLSFWFMEWTDITLSFSVFMHLSFTVWAFAITLILSQWIRTVWLLVPLTVLCLGFFVYLSLPSLTHFKIMLCLGYIALVFAIWHVRRQINSQR